MNDISGTSTARQDGTTGDGEGRLDTRRALALAMPLLAGRAVVCANGFLSRWAHAALDRPEHFYMIGSMGLASSIGLGIALAQPDRPVAVVDGDGNVLMNMGTLARIAASRPQHFLHLVIDNGVYASTGGQATISSEVPLEDVARAAGYALALRVREAPDLEPALRRALAAEGPAMVLVETVADQGPPAPRIEWTPEQIAARVRHALGGVSPA